MRGAIISCNGKFGFIAPEPARHDGAAVRFSSAFRFREGDLVEYAPGPYFLTQGGKRRGPTARTVKLVEPTADDRGKIETIFGAEEYMPWERV
jgi:hypothetical protein